MGALGLGSEPGLVRLLQAAETQAAAAQDFSVILLWANGGPSHIDTFDMKPAAPENYRGPFQPIATSVPGLDICELLPRHARLAGA